MGVKVSDEHINYLLPKRGLTASPGVAIQAITGCRSFDLPASAKSLGDPGVSSLEAAKQELGVTQATEECVIQAQAKYGE